MVSVSTASCFLGCLQAEYHGQLKSSKVLRSLNHDFSSALSFVRFRLFSLNTDFFLSCNSGIYSFFLYEILLVFFPKYLI